MNNFENCGYYVDEECTICGMGTDGEDTFCRYCKDNPNCYYKQLLKFKIENERLKEEVEQLEDFIKSSGEINHINHEYTYKLKQTLQEIKETAEETNVDCIYRISVIRKILTKAESEG